MRLTILVGMIQALSALATRHQPLATPRPKLSVRFGQDETDSVTFTQQGELVTRARVTYEGKQGAGNPGDVLQGTRVTDLKTPVVTAAADDPPALSPLQMATQLTLQLTLIGDYLSDRLGSLTGANGKVDVSSTDPFRLVVPAHELTEVHMANGIDVNDMVTISRVQDELNRLTATFPTLQAMSQLPKSTDRIRVAMRQLKTDEFFGRQREIMLNGNGVPGKQLSPNTPYPPGMTPLSHAVDPVNTLYTKVLGLIEKESQGDMSHMFDCGGPSKGGGGGGLSTAPMAPGFILPGTQRMVIPG